MRYLKMSIIILLMITGCSKTKTVNDVSSEPIPSTLNNVEIKNEPNTIDDNSLEVENNNENVEVKDEVENNNENVEVKDEVEGSSISTTDKVSTKIEDKPVEPKKKKTTYGDVRYIDETIPYNTLKDKLELNKEKGTSGILKKGQNGLKRKEVRDVYINGNLSYTEIIKEFYTVKDPINSQRWVGTKEPKPSKPSGPQDIRTDYTKSHQNDFTNHAGNIMYYFATFYDYDEALAQGWKPADQYGFDGYSILQEGTDEWFFYLHSE